MSLLKKLAIKHPYYASECNYFSNEASITFNTMTDFLNEFEDADIDLNQVFRWDIHEKCDQNEKPCGTYYAQVVIIHQRNGIYLPCTIHSVVRGEAKRFEHYLGKHYANLRKIGAPLV